MQFLARAEPLLGCDRQLVVPLATEAGLLDALNTRLPLALEPLSGPADGGPDDGGDGDADMVGSRTSGRPHLHGGGQPAVVSRARGKPRPCGDTPPPDLLIHTDILPFYLTIVPYTSLPFFASLNALPNARDDT